MRTVGFSFGDVAQLVRALALQARGRRVRVPPSPLSCLQSCVRDATRGSVCRKRVRSSAGQRESYGHVRLGRRFESCRTPYERRQDSIRVHRWQTAWTRINHKRTVRTGNEHHLWQRKGVGEERFASGSLCS